MADYTPPVSPEIAFTFKGATYTPPVSPSIAFRFGVDDDVGEEQGLLRTNYTILLTM
ncbi:hypothetical protein KWH04_01215 [Xanthomonas campestris pv. trichodesmae]|uniref:hypothetical protein n=1 Tax=Xanthomonas citri TaxID=346 RepID=UPI0012FDBAF8|nr:hypothetical protein [Xanthomonas citri]MBV6779290.1 hypothetical protein [Xanthomonas campestris pv. trichodesmae]